MKNLIKLCIVLLCMASGQVIAVVHGGAMGARGAGRASMGANRPMGARSASTRPANLRPNRPGVGPAHRPGIGYPGRGYRGRNWWGRNRWYGAGYPVYGLYYGGGYYDPLMAPPAYDGTFDQYDSLNPAPYDAKNSTDECIARCKALTSLSDRECMFSCAQQ